MDYILIPLVVTAVMFAGILAMIELGRRLGRRQESTDPDGVQSGTGVVKGAVFGLMSLLIAFTFSGAAERFEARRRWIVTETNAIGTAYLRLDILPIETQSELQDHFKKYVDSRLVYYQKLPDHDVAAVEAARTKTLQDKIWTLAVNACRKASSPAVMPLVLSSLNEMIDITTTREEALKTHPPTVVFILLGVLMLASSLLVGYDLGGERQRNRLPLATFALVLAVAIYVTLDYEFPRMGLVRINAVDQILVDLRARMK